ARSSRAATSTRDASGTWSRRSPCTSPSSRGRRCSAPRTTRCGCNRGTQTQTPTRLAPNSEKREASPRHGLAAERRKEVAARPKRARRSAAAAEQTLLEARVRGLGPEPDAPQRLHEVRARDGALVGAADRHRRALAGHVVEA